MRDALGPGTSLSYCTNVHAGTTLAQMKENLDRYALRVRELVCPRGELGVGLWLSAEVANELCGAENNGGKWPAASDRPIRELRDWLHERGLFCVTLNGFPFGNFHQPVVKHAVYEPDWFAPERLTHTIALASLLAKLLPDDQTEGTISTLPICWGGGRVSPTRVRDDLRRVFAELSDGLARVRDRTGRSVSVHLEPEPGCFLSTVADVLDVHDWVFDGVWPKGLGMCYDICHGAVMGEDHDLAMRALSERGISVGKVQVSSALGVPAGLSAAQHTQALAELACFDERRYLHQTVVESSDDRPTTTLHDELADAISHARAEHQSGRKPGLRTHFHVPVFLDRIGSLSTTSDQASGAIAAARKWHAVRHFEVETYAWGVLPPGVWQGELPEGIARELAWTIAQSRERST